MVEVLVSVLVLAFGMLAVAGMQLTAIRTTQQTAIQTTAMELVTEVADKMRANAQVMGGPDSANPFIGLDFRASAANTAPAVSCVEVDSACTPAQLALFDLFEWKKRMAVSIPGGRVVICYDENPWDVDAFSFRWECGMGGMSGSSKPIIVKLGWLAKDATGRLERATAGGDFLPQVVMVVAPYVK